MDKKNSIQFTFYTYWCQLGSLETHQLCCMYCLLTDNIINDLNYIAQNSGHLSTTFRKIEYTLSTSGVVRFQTRDIACLMIKESEI